MTTTHKLMARTVQAVEVARFEVQEGQDLDQAVVEQLDRAIAEGKLDKMATRVGLPCLMVAEVGPEPSLAGGESATSLGLYAPDGTPITGRSFEVEPAGAGFALYVREDDEDEPRTIGVFTDEGVAQQVGLFWRNGHLTLAS